MFTATDTNSLQLSVSHVQSDKPWGCPAMLVIAVFVGLHLGRPIDCFSHLATCIAPLDTVRVSPLGGWFPGQFRLDSSKYYILKMWYF